MEDCLETRRVWPTPVVWPFHLPTRFADALHVIHVAVKLSDRNHASFTDRDIRSQRQDEGSILFVCGHDYPNALSGLKRGQGCVFMVPDFDSDRRLIMTARIDRVLFATNQKKRLASRWD